MTQTTAVKALTERADSYARDARKFRDASKTGLPILGAEQDERCAMVYQAVADELRKIARQASQDASAPVVSALLRRAAHDIENSQQRARPFQAGPTVWSALYAAAHEMVAAPAAEAMRQRLRLPQLQGWQADRETVVSELRAAAGGETLDLAGLANDDAHKRLTGARERLARALGYDGADHGYTLEMLCADVESHLRQRDYRIAELERRAS